MSNFIITIIYGLTIGIALSVDAFMLSLVFGSTFKRRRESFFTSFLVGIFHFVMPLLGYFLAYIVFSQINLSKHLEGNLNFIAFVILVLLGFMMIFKKDEKEEFDIRNLINKCLFAFSVSIDSFLAGIAFTSILEHINIYIVSFIFCIVSSIATFLALSIGKKTAERLLHYNLDYIAGVLIIILAIITLFI